MVSRITSWLSSGRPRQFTEIAENSRCPILFRLLAPGGRCATVISIPSSVASRASSTFQRLRRLPSDPPQSAVISSWRAPGQACAPAESRQRRIGSAANAAVSWPVPALTHPALAARSQIPYGATLPSCLPAKSWSLTWRGEPFGARSAPPFLKFPASSFSLQPIEITGTPAARHHTTRSLM